jgi:hypothetical protein
VLGWRHGVFLKSICQELLEDGASITTQIEGNEVGGIGQSKKPLSREELESHFNRDSWLDHPPNDPMMAAPSAR